MAKKKVKLQVQITKISIQSRRKDRFSVEVNGKYSFSISSSDLVKESIASGDNLTENRLNELKKISASGLLLDKALNYLSSRPHSISEVKTYLYKKLGTRRELKFIEKKEKEGIIDQVTEKLVKNKYLDDYEFATWFTDQRINNNMPRSRRVVKSELFQKGVKPQIIDEVLKTVTDMEEQLNANKLIHKKYSQLVKQTKNSISSKPIKQKLVTYLQNKGYTWDTIKSALGTLEI